MDNHDNAQTTEGASEALYGSDLVIETGCALTTAGQAVYHETLINNGTVDVMTNLIQVYTADLNGDGRVDGADLGLLLQGWGACL